MSKQLITVKNLGGRPASISQNQVLEIIRIKGEYGILTWNKAIDLCLEIHPDWVLPHYKNCLIQINKVFSSMLLITNKVLEENRKESLKKTTLKTK
jgi:hypothetical protein